MIKFTVLSHDDKKALLAASKHIHDANIDTDIPMVNTLAHLYRAEDLIVVENKFCKHHSRDPVIQSWVDMHNIGFSIQVINDRAMDYLVANATDPDMVRNIKSFMYALHSGQLDRSSEL